MALTVRPIRLREAQEYCFKHHRHNDPPHAWLFGVAAYDGDDRMVGVGVAGRPVAGALDDGLTFEVVRTCTDGTRNANSLLYGALWRAARALGYLKGVTYIQGRETGASLKASGWRKVAELPARGDWAECSVKHRDLRDPPQASLFEEPKKYTGGVPRERWEIYATSAKACSFAQATTSSTA